VQNIKEKATSPYPYIYGILPCGIAILGILFGSFFDWNISSAIADTSNGFGGFIETFGLSLSFATIPLGGVMIFKGLYDNRKTALKVIGWIFLLMSIGISFYLFSDKLILSKSVTHGLTLPVYLAYIFGFLFTVLFTLASFFFIQSKDKRGLMIVGALFISVMILQSIFIELLKNLNCRPRYRFLIDNEANTDNLTFRSWWEFVPFTAQNDGLKSWPSGHTGTTAVVLLLPLIHEHIRYPFPHSREMFWGISLFLTFLVAFYRIRYGAHFLSDVSFGLLFTSLIILLCLYTVNRISKIKKPSESVNQ
jgi:membrane-associated phospholipid phosphatase